MNSAFTPLPHDLTFKPLPPASPTDPRVPMAEEFSMDREIAIARWRSSRVSGWRETPQYQPDGMKIKLLGGKALLKTYPIELALDTTIVIPALETSTLFIKRDDVLSLVAFAAEVGELQDPNLGKVSFKYREPGTNNVVAIAKENSRRYRAFWILALTQKLPTLADILAGLSSEANGDRRIAIANTLDTGFVINPGLRFYAKDPNLVASSPYTVLPETLEILPILSIRRIQNFEEGGYTYGVGGEEPLSTTTISLLAEPLQKDELTTRVRKRFLDICAGVPGRSSTYKRTVLNLTAGQVAGNPGRAGVPASSPNGSVCLANDQRVSFTNQAVTQKTGVTVIPSAGNNGSGKALIATGLNTNAPSGSTFSDNRTDHKIFAADGSEQSALGAFSNLGGSGSLQWVAGDNATIKPGSPVFFVPAIRYPSGSGFSVPYSKIERVWLNGAAVSAENIRYGGTSDLDAYEDPFNNESFIVISGPERAAVHYIYKAISVRTDVAGTLTIPVSGNVERGCFAFIQGVQGRIDKPVHTGLLPETVYKTLVYYPPRSLESWQFQILYPDYQGRAQLEPDWLQGAVITTPTLLYAHTQGGGLSVHRGDAILQRSPVAMHLPKVAEPEVQAYQFDAPVQLPGETYMGPVVFRELPLISAPGMALPMPGQVLSLQKFSGIESRSLNAALTIGGQMMGWRSPLLNSKSPFQTAVIFGVQKGDEVRLVVVTKNCTGDDYSTIVADPRQDAAIDLFMV